VEGYNLHVVVQVAPEQPEDGKPEGNWTMWAKIHWEEPISVKVFATKSEAAKTGNDGTIVGSSTDIDQNTNLLTSDILAVYNHVSGLTVARFSDRPSGAKRLWAAINEMPEAKELYDKIPKSQENGDGNEAASVTSDDNGNKAEQENEDMAATAKKTTAKKGAKKAAKSSARKSVGKTAKKAGASAARGPRASGTRTKKMFPAVKENPYRSGKSKDTFEMVMKKPGKTFHEYVALGGRANTLAGAIRDGHVTLKD